VFSETPILNLKTGGTYSNQLACKGWQRMFIVRKLMVASRLQLCATVFIGSKVTS